MTMGTGQGTAFNNLTCKKIIMNYQAYIAKKLQDLEFLERVNAQTKQNNLIQTTLSEIANPKLKQEICKTIINKPDEEIYFSAADWERFTRENIEKDFAWKMEDRRQQNKKAFKAIQARSFEKAAMSALYGEDSLETYEESSSQ